MLRMVSYPRRPQSGHITCYLNRTYHVLPTLLTLYCLTIPRHSASLTPSKGTASPPNSSVIVLLRLLPDNSEVTRNAGLCTVIFDVVLQGCRMGDQTKEGRIPSSHSR
jgi:hypothetical protein